MLNTLYIFLLIYHHPLTCACYMKSITLLLITIMLCRVCTGQKIDSLYSLVKQAKTDSGKSKALAGLAYALSANNPDSALQLAWQGLALGKQSGNKAAQASCLQSIGWTYFRAGKNDSSINYLKQSASIFHQLKNLREEGKVLKNIGSVYISSRDYTHAFEVLIPAKKIFEDIKDERYAAYIDKEIGGIYRQKKLLPLAKQYLSSAIATFEKIHDSAYLSDAMSAYGSVFWAEKKYDSALYFYRKEYKISQLLPNMANLAYSAENLGTAFYSLCGEKNTKPWVDSALFYFTKAQDYFKKMQDTTDVFFEKINIGATLVLTKNYPSAAQNLHEALRFFNNIKDTAEMYEIYTSLSSIYQKTGDYKTAYGYLDSAAIYNDSLTAKDNRNNIAAMFAKYEADKKDATIKLLNTQKELDQQQISRQHIITLFIASFTLLGIFTALILWNRRNIKQKLGEVEMRNQLSSDLHDDIGSSLSSILLLSNLAAQNKEDEGMRNKLLEKINSNAKEMIERMGDIVWTMNPRYDEGDSLRERIENYTSRLQEITPVAIHTNIDKNIEHYHFSMELRKNIFLIIKEAMNNALKYAAATRIALDLTVANNCLTLIINDNGKGFTLTEKTNGNGLDTMIQRARASGGNCTVASSPGNGTLVKAVIPIPNNR